MIVLLVVGAYRLETLVVDTVADAPTADRDPCCSLGPLFLFSCFFESSGWIESGVAAATCADEGCAVCDKWESVKYVGVEIIVVVTVEKIASV